VDTICAGAGGGKTAGEGVFTPATGTTLVVVAEAGANGLDGAATSAVLVAPAVFDADDDAAGAVTGSNIGAEATAGGGAACAATAA